MELSGDPGEFRCPVWRCPLPGARWVVLHEHWRLAVCDVHADDVDQHAEAWQIVAVRDDVLRIARTGGPAPGGWIRDEEKGAKT